MKSIKYLYRELFRQQKICGIVFSICGAITLCAQLIIYSTSNTDIVVQMGANFFAYFIMYIGGMAFPLAGFAYLNKRNSADIYHSIPASRLQLFAATAAASASWIVALQIVTYAVAMMGYLLLGIRFSLVQALCEFAHFTVGSLYIAAGTMIAVSISGTTLTALMTALVVNFVPRLLLTAIAGNIARADQMLCFDRLGILAPQLNFAFGSSFGMIFSELFDSYSTVMDHMMASWTTLGAPFWYTLFAALALTAAAAWLFVRRKSESAGRAAVSPFVQHIIRCGVASPFIIALSMTYFDSHGYELDESYFWIIILASLCVYVIYELISRRSVKQTLKTIPLFVMMTVVILASGVGADAAGRLAAKRTLDISDVKSVCFDGNAEMFPMDNSYSWAKYGRLRFDQPEIIASAVNALDQTVNAQVRRGETATLRVDYQTKLGTVTRYVDFATADVRKITDLTLQDERVQKLSKEMPKGEDAYRINVDCYNYHYVYNYSSESDLTRAEKEQLWDMAVSEYIALTDTQKVDYYAEYGSYSYIYSTVKTEVQSRLSIGSISATGIRNGKSYSIQLTLNHYFPKTIALMYELIGSDALIQETAGVLQNLNDSDYFEWQLCYYSPNGATLDVSNLTYMGYDQELDAATKEQVEKDYEILDPSFPLLDLPSLIKTGDYRCVIADNSMMTELAALMKSGKCVSPDMNTGYYMLQVHRQYDGYGDSYTVTFSVKQ